MGIILSRRKKREIVVTQPSSNVTSPQPDNQDRRQHLCDVITFSDDESESDAEEKSEAKESRSDSETQSNGKRSSESESEHNSSRSASVGSKGSVKNALGTVGKNNEKPSGGASEVEEFTVAWKKALLEDLDIKISDNVKIVRIFTSSTFTGICMIIK